MRHRRAVTVLLLVTAAFGLWTGAGRAYGQSGGLLPDLVTVVPSQLAVAGVGKGTTGSPVLRFSNIIANLGPGRLQVRGVHSGGITYAYQEILDASNQVVASLPAGTYEYHASHGHWHIDAVAGYWLRAGTLDGTAVASESKVSFCLIDTEKIFGKGSGQTAGPRTYTSCNSALQGITYGWADKYIYSLPGQELPIAGLPAGIYYLISTADPTEKFVENDDNNNTAWVKLELSYVNGQPRITELDHSPCSGLLCGAGRSDPKP